MTIQDDTMSTIEIKNTRARGRWQTKGEGWLSVQGYPFGGDIRVQLNADCNGNGASVGMVLTRADAKFLAERLQMLLAGTT